METTTYNIIPATFERYYAEETLTGREYFSLEFPDGFKDKFTLCFNEQGRPISIYDATGVQQPDMSAKLNENIIAITFYTGIAFSFDQLVHSMIALHNSDTFAMLAKYNNNFSGEYQYLYCYTVWEITTDFLHDKWTGKLIGAFSQFELPRFTLYSALVMLLKQCVPALEHLMRTVDESAEYSVVYQNVLNDIRNFLKKEESNDSTR
jgi:hypothetical protein